MDKWFLLGIFYGYPTCCINAFRKRGDMIRLTGNVQKYSLTEKQIEVSDGRGFIPCPSCAEKVTKETIETLLDGRICTTPFPQDSVEEADNYLEFLEGATMNIGHIL